VRIGGFREDDSLFPDRAGCDYRIREMKAGGLTMRPEVKELENGNWDRRRILQALGVIAAGGFAASALSKTALAFAARAAQSAASAGKSFPVTTVNHLALSSHNYRKSRDFYVDLFGMRVAWDDGFQCALEFGSLTAPNGMYIRPVSKPGEKPTLGHMAFGIPNFISQKAAMKAELARRGIRNVRPDGEVGWSCNDAAGYPLNIWVPEKDKAMFPGAAGPCAIAASEKCVAAWEKGQKNLNAAPKPSGKGFQATSYSFIVLNVPDVAKERDFYRDLLGMKIIYDKREGPNAECFLTFGQNMLQLRKMNNPAGKPYCNRFGMTVENYDQNAVKAELERRGLKAKPNSKLSWSIVDPDGYHIDVSAAGFAEHLANDCHGSSATCPGGLTG
jgi:catechol 2,3-dioxygenase-like lactoylglutathione lyase family enzyme